MRKKGLVAFGLAAVMTASALTGCGGASDKKESGKKEAKGTVYYLNFKPEADAQWQELGYEGVGQAKAVIFFLAVIVISMLQLRLTRSKEVQQ